MQSFSQLAKVTSAGVSSSVVGSALMVRRGFSSLISLVMSEPFHVLSNMIFSLSLVTPIHQYSPYDFLRLPAIR